MLTVKHITPDGEEALYEAHEVRFNPNSIGESKGRTPSRGTLLCHGSRGDEPYAPVATIMAGTAYVMNSSGSTVAKYDLGGWYLSEPKPEC